MNSNVSFRFRLIGLKHVFFYSRCAGSSDSAPPAVYMLEVIGSELMAQNHPSGQFWSRFAFTIYIAQN